MLSEVTKAIIRDCVSAYDKEWQRLQGAVYVVRSVLETCPRESVLEVMVVANIEANRAEAERYVAGLLGMT